MAVKTTLRLGTLVDETISAMLRPNERPLEVRLGATDLPNPSSTQITVSDASAIGVSSLLEHRDELMLVTAKSQDPTPVLTVARGYAGTPVRSPASQGAVLRRDPAFPRHEVGTWVKRSFLSIGGQIPNLRSETYFRTPGEQNIILPANTLDVFQVRYMVPLAGRPVEIGQWEFEPNMPPSVAASGKMLRLPSYVQDDDELIVVSRTTYEWQGTDEDATIEVPYTADDLPVLYASAYGQMRREVSRAELDKIEEWNQEQAIRAGVNLRLVRDLWGEYYRRLDEVRQTHPVPKHRPFRKRPRSWF